MNTTPWNVFNNKSLAPFFSRNLRILSMVHGAPANFVAFHGAGPAQERGSFQSHWKKWLCISLDFGHFSNILYAAHRFELNKLYNLN